MAGIYKIGFPAERPQDDAKSEALAHVRRSDSDDVLEIGIIQADEHKAAGEYLVRIVTGQPEPELQPEPSGPPADQLAAEREQLLARLAEIDAQMTGTS
ncbi:hypothetical protein AB0C08_11315 [Microbispora bryophytorum]|uniref:hypothetical protein n=1 Tax=Microbispora bryophytorum TaxID=1460882 RepID=UPI003409EAE1